MGKEIPTAKEYLEKLGDSWEDNGETYADRFSSQNLIEFTKLHVQKSLEMASKKVELTDVYEEMEGDGLVVDLHGNSHGLRKNSIIDAYNLNNIK